MVPWASRACNVRPLTYTSISPREHDFNFAAGKAEGHGAEYGRDPAARFRRVDPSAGGVLFSSPMERLMSLALQADEAHLRRVGELLGADGRRAPEFWNPEVSRELYVPVPGAELRVYHSRPAEPGGPPADRAGPRLGDHPPGLPELLRNGPRPGRAVLPGDARKELQPPRPKAGHVRAAQRRATSRQPCRPWAWPARGISCWWAPAGGLP